MDMVWHGSSGNLARGVRHGVPLPAPCLLWPVAGRQGRPSRERADDPSPGRRRPAARDRGLGGGRGAAPGDRRQRHASAILGRPVEAEHLVSVASLTGITLYEPDELVMSAGAGTPLAMIEAELAERGQELMFEPADYGALLGRRPRQPDDRRRVRGQCRRAAAAEVGCRARPPARPALRHRPCPGDQDRRPGGQERHRLRPVQAAHRLLGHAGGPDPGHLQGDAARRGRA